MKQLVIFLPLEVLGLLVWIRLAIVHLPASHGERGELVT